MKKICILTIAFFTQFQIIGCSGNAAQNNCSESTITETGKIEVYYFHFTRRCATCNAVENVTKEALQTFYAEKMDNDEITFLSINLDEESNKALAEKIGVSAQALLVISGEKKIDLTNDGFMHAKNNPEKLKVKIEETINALLED